LSGGKLYLPMNTNPQTGSPESPLTIRFHLTDGSVHSFAQADATINAKLRHAIEPSRLFAHQRIVVGSEHSKSVFVTAEINRVDFVHHSIQCWEFPMGWSDIVELLEEEFRKQANLDEPSRMTKREQPTPTGDMMVSFIKLHMRGGQPLFVMVEAAAKLPAESQSFMQYLLAKGAIHLRLRGGGIGVLNLANLAGYTVYPGVAQIPADSWLAEPVANSSHPHASTRR
jgi:hypothetical protein